MPFDGNNPYSKKSSGFSHFGKIGDPNSSHQAVILRHTMLDGKIKVFEDSKGIAQRTEIFSPEGKVVIYKDYAISENHSHYKKIDIYSLTDELHGTIEIFPSDWISRNPVYRFFYKQSEIGKGYGEIAIYIAQRLLGESVDSRTGVGTEVDEEVIKEIKNILQSRNI